LIAAFLTIPCLAPFHIEQVLGIADLAQFTAPTPPKM
jgi:hypothetical protein